MAKKIKDKFGIIRHYKDGQLHRENGPAVEYPNGSKEWWFNGVLHRLDGPAVENINGDNAWYINGEIIKKIQSGIELIFENGLLKGISNKVEMISEKEMVVTTYDLDKTIRFNMPVMEKKEFFYEGKLQSLNDNPAVIFENGDKEYWDKGALHRYCGPAREIAIDHDRDEFWEHGIRIYPTSGPLSKKSLKNKKRDTYIFLYYMTGKYSTEKLSKKFKLTKERIRQIVKKKLNVVNK